MLKNSYKNLLCDPELDNIWTSCAYTEAPYPEEIRDPSAFFATFETGDNTVVTVETGAVPLDMYYSRASNFGDDWDEQDICAVAPEDSWYPNTSAVCEEGETELRWDWLENGDDWATEASVEGNPSGDKFYAVWNQELFLGFDEDGVELYTNMNSLFRRIFYNLYAEATATASILYQSDLVVAHNRGGELVLSGSGRDYDHLGEGEDIVEVLWTSDLQGTLGNENVIKIPVTDLNLGTHTIVFKVKDNEGVWSADETTKVIVMENLYQVHLPTIVR